jgi:hypothetical protein
MEVPAGAGTAALARPACPSEGPGGTRMFNRACLAAKQRVTWLSYRMMRQAMAGLARDAGGSA